MEGISKTPTIQSVFDFHWHSLILGVVYHAYAGEHNLIFTSALQKQSTFLLVKFVLCTEARHSLQPLQSFKDVELM